MVQIFSHSASQASPPLRGIIIADASALISMEQPVCREGKSEESTLSSYLDLLPYLAEQGFKVIIPEMVAYETVTALSGNSSLDIYFPESKNSHPKLEQFIKAVGQGKWQNITIASSPNQPAGVTQFLADLHDIVQRHRTANPVARNELRRAQCTEKTDFGDKAIAALADDILSAPSSPPVFVLTTDRHAMAEISSRLPKANMLNPNGLYDGLIKNGFNQKVGFASKVNVRTLIEKMVENKPSQNADGVPGHTAVIDLSGKKYVEAQEYELNRIRGELPVYDMSKDKPFSACMDTLAKETGLKPANFTGRINPRVARYLNRKHQQGGSQDRPPVR